MSISSETGTLSVSVVIPALNEEATVSEVTRAVVADLAGRGIDYEIIMVNDGSTDRTGEKMMVMAAGEPRLQVVSHAVPGGVGRAFRLGAARARCMAVICFPADGENHPGDIAILLTHLAEADAVVPVPANPDIRPWTRRCLSWCYSRLVNLLFGTAFSYPNGTVLYRRELLARLPLRADGFFYQAEALVLAARLGARFREVPIRLIARAGGRSKAIAWRVLRTVIADCLRLRLAGPVMPR